MDKNIHLQWMVTVFILFPLSHSTMITRKNLLYSTFIGLPVRIVNSSQRRLVGLEGAVVDETKNMVAIERADGSVVKVQKAACTFRFTLDSGETADVDGAKIAFRPYERPKKV